jgi:thiol-disulfide isomerase/thioredoxin
VHSFTRRLVLLVAALSLPLTACGSTTSSDVPEPADQPVIEESTPQEAPAPDSPDTEITTAVSPGSYVTLAEYETNKAELDETNVVLFFSAAWCSTCKQARENIEADLAAIPSDLTIVVVDYDDSDDLKRKYGVTLQHTFVQIDAAGNELAKWSGSVTTRQIAENTV